MSTTIVARSGPHKQLFFEFISQAIGAPVLGVQRGFAQTPDQILFEGPRGTTLCIPFGALIDIDEARRAVMDKLRRSEAAFTAGERP